MKGLVIRARHFEKIINTEASVCKVAFYFGFSFIDGRISNIKLIQLLRIFLQKYIRKYVAYDVNEI